MFLHFFCGLFKEEILTSLEENMAALQGMQGQGRYVEYFIDTVNRWKYNLGNTESVLIDWLDVQTKWMVCFLFCFMCVIHAI